MSTMVFASSPPSLCDQWVSYMIDRSATRSGHVLSLQSYYVPQFAVGLIHAKHAALKTCPMVNNHRMRRLYTGQMRYVMDVIKQTWEVKCVYNNITSIISVASSFFLLIETISTTNTSHSSIAICTLCLGAFAVQFVVLHAVITHWNHRLQNVTQVQGYMVKHGN